MSTKSSPPPPKTTTEGSEKPLDLSNTSKVNGFGKNEKDGDSTHTGFKETTRWCVSCVRTKEPKRNIRRRRQIILLALQIILPRLRRCPTFQV
ncbi:hypothetical protein TNCT_534101 [Trichonephila clavata]|uniref:Uncharacterized protein n=1 Tax=Trichonephila clavata TaxID=2740835 RepID=A0A8X6LXU3_TRICU|nr:hypothetical protein TNCT_534101 [Trichonephila clavata]